jgi:hypothetical protein
MWHDTYNILPRRVLCLRARMGGPEYLVTRINGVTILDNTDTMSRAVRDGSHHLIAA